MSPEWLELLRDAEDEGKAYVVVEVHGASLEAVANGADVEGWDFIAITDPNANPSFVSVMFRRKK